VADGRAAMGGGQEGRDKRQIGGPSGGQEGRDGRRTAATGGGREGRDGRRTGGPRQAAPARGALSSARAREAASGRRRVKENRIGWMQRWRAHGRQLADGGGPKKTGSGGCGGDAPHPNPTCSDSMLPWMRDGSQ
jgi:hypothetical protein